jgi:ABC-type amino acid transport substrate-binding protein
MRINNIVLVVLVSLITTFGAYRYLSVTGQRVTAELQKAETPFDRIMRTDTIRCGYVLYEPFVHKDPNTGVFSGVAVDLMDRIGTLLNLKIEWTEEVGWATTIEGLKTRRYDLMCVGFWRQSLEAKYMFYTQTFSYRRVGIIVRQDDHRFDKDQSRINQPDVRIVSSDGELASAIAHRDYPQAQLLEAPNMTDFTQRLEDITDNKADVTFIEDAITDVYLKNNPYKLRRLDVPPVRVFQNTLAFLPDERLKSMLDTAVIELVENGEMDRILDKYDPVNKMLLRIKRPGQP